MVSTAQAPGWAGVQWPCPQGASYGTAGERVTGGRACRLSWEEAPMRRGPWLWREVAAVLGRCSPKSLFRLLLSFIVFSFELYLKVIQIRNVQSL